MAADPTELAALTRKLRGKGLSEAQVVDSLRGLGFTKAQAEEAAGSGKTTPAPAPAPPAPKARPTGETPTPAGGSAPTFKAPDLSGLSLTPPSKLRAGDLGGFAAGLVIYTLMLNFLRYGQPGVSGWMRAKFLNQPAALGTGTTKPGKGSSTDKGLTSTRPTTTST